MKARDIIPGWPRGRSTVGFGVAPKEYCLWFPSWKMADDRFRIEAEADERYYAEQQDMVNAVFERYRLDPVVATMRISRVPRWMAVAMREGERRGLVAVEYPNSRENP